MDKDKKGFKKINIGKLRVDPVFLALFGFFTASALFMLGYILLSIR
ncbi:MAG: hypothetical protein ACYDEQ_00880 [Desulfocucumaceae bacterium]